MSDREVTGRGDWCGAVRIIVVGEGLRGMKVRTRAEG